MVETNSARSRKSAAQTAAQGAAQTAATGTTADVLDTLAQLDQPVSETSGGQRSIPNGRTERRSADELNQEREWVAELYRGIREQFFQIHGYYPNDAILQDEGFKHLVSREFGINLMLLGGKLAEQQGMSKEQAYLKILDELGVDTAPFRAKNLLSGAGFNWRYYQFIPYQLAVDIKNKILSVYAAELRKDRE